MDVLGWRCESGCRIEASRVGSDRTGPHRRISGGHLNICRVDVMFPFGCWISYWIVDDRSGPARSAPRKLRAGSGSGPLGMNIQINCKITYVECTLGTEY